MSKSRENPIRKVHATALAGLLRKAKVPQIILLVGDEEYFKETALAAVMERLGRDGEEAELVRRSLSEMSAGELEGELGSSNLFGGARVVLLKHADELANEKVLKGLRERLAGNVFALLSLGKGAQVGRIRGLAGKALIVECPKVYDENRSGWVQSHFKQKFGKTIPARAAMMLVELAGQDLAQLDEQLEKLDLYTGEGKRVTEKDVEEVIGPVRAFARYEMANAVAQKNTTRALRTVKTYLSRGIGGTVLVSWIASHFRELLRAKRIAASKGREAIARELGVRAFIARILATQAKEFTEEELESNLSLLLKAQSALRSGSPMEEVTVESVIVQLCEGNPEEGR